MTLLSNLMALFPLSVLFLCGASFIYAYYFPHPFNFLWPVAILYIYPVFVFRLVNLFVPLKEGSFDLAQKKYNPWWGSHQIQLIYFACPFLEGLLRLVPGLYSFWLRLWGAKVGKNIYWTPSIEISDRPLIEIGDQVIIGHKAHFISHVIIPYKAKISLYVKKIQIGEASFIGAGSRFGPGVKVDPDTQLPVLTDGRVNQHFKSGNQAVKPS